MAEKSKVYSLILSILVILSFVLMIAVVCFQLFEVDKYEIQDHMKSSIAGLFSSNAGSAE